MIWSNNLRWCNKIFLNNSTIVLHSGILAVIHDDWNAPAFYSLSWRSTLHPEHEFIYMSSLDSRSMYEASGICENGHADQYYAIIPNYSAWVTQQRPALS